MEILKRAWQLSPDDYQICRELARACSDQELWAEFYPSKTTEAAKAKADKVRFATAAVSANPASPHSYADLADALLPFGATGGSMTNYHESHERFIEGGDDRPGYLTPRFGLRIGDKKRILYGPIWEFDPEKVDAQDLRDAFAGFRESIRLEPTLAYVRERLANVLVLKGEIENARVEYREAARLNPHDRNIHTEAVHRFYLKGRLELAIAEMQEAIRLDPTSEQDHLLLGIFYHEQGKQSQAFAEYREALRRGGNFAGLVTHALAAIGKPEDVLGVYRELLKDADKLKLTNPSVFNNLAWALATSPDGRFPDAELAIEMATKACELSKWKDPVCLDTVSAAYAESGDFGSAVKWQTKAIELLPDEKEKEDYRTRLKLYQERKPYHLPGP